MRFMTDTVADQIPPSSPRAGTSAYRYSVVSRLDDGRLALRLQGDWTLDHAKEIDSLMMDAVQRGRGVEVIDVSRMGRMDTTGTILVRRHSRVLGGGRDLPVVGILPIHSALLSTITCCPPEEPTEPDYVPMTEQVLTDIGSATMNSIMAGGTLLSFLGLVVSRLATLGPHPGRLRMTSLVAQIEEVGFKSMGIVGLISVLIGAVMVNQGAVQLAKFGADIFVIDMVGIGQLRELGILLTAIIIAGRSGSAFTAQIGSMKLNEEVDAIQTIGMNPIDVLVTPRVLALMIALPLLTFYADILGIAGGAAMAWAQLGISPANFLFYLREVVPIENLWVGIIKAPFFAMVIAISGCYEGLKVEQSAESLGKHVTRSVVQSIFLVIALDALFAIFFTAVGL